MYVQAGCAFSERLLFVVVVVVRACVCVIVARALPNDNTTGMHLLLLSEAPSRLKTYFTSLRLLC